ncbi:hypothetical protein LZ558_12960 [Methylobacter sp. YRD-M1]|nr:hypothetical protein [Methylobacter sp. YRD-M1]WAK00755.1 hypothetical protein LZ558_12960 [Methylobacter sp. YRD-M1]
MNATTILENTGGDPGNQRSHSRQQRLSRRLCTVLHGFQYRLTTGHQHG